MLAEGTVLDGKYEIRGRLGGGGMGDVYLARRRLLGDDVAVKVLRPSGPDPDAWRERFLREARACAQLRHPHIVSVLDFSVGDPEQPYLVMEYLNGPSLADELRSRGRFDLVSVRQIVRAVGGALSLAHASGVAHRDLKPQNIVSHRYQSGEIVYKVIDFGLVTLRAGDDQTPLTSAHEFLGTVAYAAPEQFSGAPADARSDQVQPRRDRVRTARRHTAVHRRWPDGAGVESSERPAAVACRAPCRPSARSRLSGDAGAGAGSLAALAERCGVRQRALRVR